MFSTFTLLYMRTVIIAYLYSYSLTHSFVAHKVFQRTRAHTRTHANAPTHTQTHSHQHIRYLYIYYMYAIYSCLTFLYITVSNKFTCGKVYCNYKNLKNDTHTCFKMKLCVECWVRCNVCLLCPKPLDCVGVGTQLGLHPRLKYKHRYSTEQMPDRTAYSSKHAHTAYIRNHAHIWQSV